MKRRANQSTHSIKVTALLQELRNRRRSLAVFFAFKKCRRFANLYSYVRCLRTAAEKWDHEPDWVVQFRGKLANAMAHKASGFGTPIIAWV
ncbi:hypothetical protein [Paenibacillus sp. MMS18-CY102]|uniref:hypothetical protein n=1 Tax=Paenibacillus sp. MMS18-CY102 TaxID=2682849 RepID=UPI00136595A3|nr:hypothetical protein [Paenibacillus sp. MMS18-CY102]MWC30163.1 hypothetical protein [Paenibacillus sp. MMS18-CY102]